MRGKASLASAVMHVAVAAGLLLLAGSAPAAAAEELPPLVHDMGIGLFLSGLLAVLFTRIKFPAIAGYILAGIVAGPLGLGWSPTPPTSTPSPSSASSCCSSSSGWRWTSARS